MTMRRPLARALGLPVLAVALLLGAGAVLRAIEWTQPRGEPLAVSLLQGNVAQEQKFDPAFRVVTFRLYDDLVAQSRGRLVVLPESAFPMFGHQVPASVVQGLAGVAAQRNGLVLVGLFTAEPPLPGTTDNRYYNTVAALGGEQVALYRKRHLVPFGESIPFKAWLGPLLDRVLAIPLADQARGDADQAPFAVAGHRVATNICYEDAFGSELIGAARRADILVNVTNDAWYGESIAAWQHNQIAAMRALELGRPMLRATNTGVTSYIDARGEVRAELPWFTRGVLEVSLRGREGLTPFVRLGNAVPVLACLALAAGAFLVSRRRP
jgi:apolipoprotein N-acyltransferase